jgi:hypothetical protein
MISLTKPSIQCSGWLKHIRRLWKLIGEDFEALEAELSVSEGQW